jgi:hypothetical protein
MPTSVLFYSPPESRASAEPVEVLVEALARVLLVPQ